MTEDRVFTARKSNGAAHGEFTSATTHATTHNGNAQHTALGKTIDCLDPTRHTEPATRLSSTVMGNEAVRICALVRDELERHVSIDFIHPIIVLIVHAIANGNARSIIQRDATI